jgi:hypothetical protein
MYIVMSNCCFGPTAIKGVYKKLSEAKTAVGGNKSTLSVVQIDDDKFGPVEEVETQKLEECVSTLNSTIAPLDNIITSLQEFEHVSEKISVRRYEIVLCRINGNKKWRIDAITEDNRRIRMSLLGSERDAKRLYGRLQRHNYHIFNDGTCHYTPKEIKEELTPYQRAALKQLREAVHAIKLSFD